MVGVRKKSIKTAGVPILDFFDVSKSFLVEKLTNSDPISRFLLFCIRFLF
jgi:hypothetical protein